jgi:glycerol-3-phosphate cytidylyltransferase-like family protein
MVIADAPLIVTSEFLEAHDISCVVHGANISDKAIEEVYGAPYRDGKLRLMDQTERISTTELILRILSGKHGRA